MLHWVAEPPSSLGRRAWASQLRRLGAAVVALCALGACHDDQGPSYVDYGCLAEGRCECRLNIDCQFGQACLDGHCVGVTPADTSAPDTSAPDTRDATASEVDAGPSAGEFLWPCESDGECNSGKCLRTDGGMICTKRCIEECPEGFQCRGLAGVIGTVDFFCVPDRDRLCEPCSTDAACPGVDNLCVGTIEDATCGRDCRTEACPDGYDCADVTSLDGVASRQCRPTSGVCQCTLDQVGADVPCSVENEHGVCFGTQVCLEGSQLGPCGARTPAAEVCDGLDNDCNGFVDDGIPPSACEHANEVGRCTGQLLCVADVGEVCTAQIPTVESCDGRDNDCDGSIDEDFRDAEGRYDQLDHCGQCNKTCRGALPNAEVTACDTSSGTATCVVVACQAGFVLGDGVCVRPPDLLCEPCTSDAACGGPRDHCLAIDPTDTRSFCTRDCGAGNIYGTGCPTGYTCDQVPTAAGVVPQCVPANDSCDCGPDNVGQVRPCTQQNQFGTCFGLATCDADQGFASCTAKVPAAEICNGLDDDCDGLTDEGLGGATCLRDNAFGSCPGVQLCDGAAGTLVCAGPDAAEEVCNGVDDDCDGETDEPFAVNVRGPGGEVVALKYSLTDDNCGACGVVCRQDAPVTGVTCDGSGAEPFCRVTSCEPGYYVFSDGRACLPIPTNNLCLPCESATDCQGPADACLTDYADGSRCGRDCSVGSIYSTGGPGDPGYCSGVDGQRGCCPGGYLCESGQCRRESDACDCDVEGKIRPCSASNAFGTCAGVERCVVSGPGAGWQACDARTPAAEVCDGVDNDCDQLVDQADDSIDTSGLSGYPTCQNVSSACGGEWVCAQGAGGFGWSCTARTPTTEICNGLDDNCDGRTDEGFVDAQGRYAVSTENCGQCGLDCAVAVANLARQGAGVAPGAVTCDVVGGAATCVPHSCAAGFTPFPTTGTPRLCLPLTARSCQPCASDGECGPAGDRCVSVGADDGTYCAQRCDAAAPYGGCTGQIGAQGCCEAGFTCEARGADKLCQPASGSCQCRPDTAGLARVCEATGNGGTTTCFGTETCALSGGSYGWGACDLSANVEVCDGLDNDCDGVTDETFLIDGVYGTDANCGECGRNCTLAYSAEEQHVFGVCDAGAAGGPACTIGGCLDTRVGGGRLCGVDADCAGGEVCRGPFQQCVKACASDAACGAGGRCVEGACAIACTSDATCATAGLTTARCDAGACSTLYAWTDLDTLPGNGCECPAASDLAADQPDVLSFVPVPGAIYADRDCDGIDGDLETAIFVASGAFGGDGTLGAPFGTIQAAIDAFGPGDSAILVATGVYEERITLKNGASLYGGYSADFGERDIVLFPTVIDGPAPAVGQSPGTVRAVGITQATRLAGFTIVGYDATVEGTPSVAIYISGSTSALEIVNDEIIGGRGAPGATGANGARGDNGGDGQDGLHSRECANANCTNGAETQAGGAGGASASCPMAAGCVGMEADTNEDKQVPDAAAPGCIYGRGGDKGTYQNGDVSLCKYDLSPNGNQTGASGGDGASGAVGGAGGGCTSARGSVSGGVWAPGSGTVGGEGQAGTGGMGGAAGGWVVNNKRETCTIPAEGANYGDVGGSGAGGGAGGCGGTGGQPGGGGGASFGIFLVPAASAPTIRWNVITRGIGGDGGNGGNSGTGGTGGIGGQGGESGWPAWGGGVGGNGGRGGDGGNGGGGGGGCGGPSFGIAGPGIATGPLAANNSFTVLDTTPTGGPAGRGGSSPSPGSEGGDGVVGTSKNVEAY